MNQVFLSAVILVAFLLSPATSAKSEESSSSEPLKMVGEARFEFLFWDIYDSQLFSQNGQYQADKRVEQQLPLKLNITYLRDIDADDLVDNTVEQWQGLGLDKEKIALYQQQIQSLWPDIKKKDQLAFLVTTEGSQFFFNDEPIGQQLSAGFGVSFISIWLAKETSQPKLRSQLISGR